MKTAKSLLLVLALLFATFSFSQNCTVNAGIDQSVCTSTATLVGAQPENKATTWSQILGPSAIITSPSSKSTTVTGLVGGNTYRFKISTVCSDGFPTLDTVTVYAQNFPVASAGAPFTICTGVNAASLQAGTLQSGETGVWTFVTSGTSAALAGLTINNPTSPTSTLTLAAGTSNSGNVTLRWTVTNTASGCTAYSDVVVTKIAYAPVNAGVDKSVTGCYSATSTVRMTASASGGGTYGVWTVITGPNTPSISSVNAYNADVSNLIQGVYILRWTVTTPCMATTSDDVQITVNAAVGSVSTATASVVGKLSTEMPYCDIPQSITLAGSAYNAATETVTWTKTSGVATIASPNERYTSVSGFNGTSTVFRYTITNIATGCSVASSNLTVSFEASQTLSITTPSPLALACNVTSATINISHSGTTTPQWVVASAPTGYTPAAYANITGSSFTISNLTVAGTYVVRVKKTVGNCTTIYDDINVVVSKSPTGANAGSDPVLACNATQATLIGNTVAAPNTGKWTQVSGPNTANISAPTTAQTNVTGLIAGVYEFRWTITNGPACATTQDDVRVKVAAANPTTSAAGVDQSICSSTPLFLDGNIPLSNETGTWTVSPSTGVTFSNRNNPKAVVTGLASSTIYTFTWTIANLCSSSADNVRITTGAILGPIAALAGADQCLASGTTSVTLAGNSPSSGTGLWTKLSGGNATITTPTQYNTTVSGLSNGTYEFIWSISRNECTVTHDTVKITISAPVTTANAGPDQLAICGSSTTLAANTPSAGTGLWTQVGGLGGAVITDPTSPTSSVTNLSDGQYAFRWTISNNACSSSSDDMLVFASTAPTTPAAGVDKTVCGAATVTMTANAITNGTGYWNVVSGPNAPVITTNSSSTTTVTSLITGVYVFTWNSRNGLCTPLSDEVIVTVVPAASAGSNQVICGVTSTTLTGNANTAGTWTFVTPSQSTETLTTTGDNTASVSNLIQGTLYTFKYTLSAAEACALSKEATVTVDVKANATAAQAGTDDNVCITDATTTLTLAGNNPSIGTGTWTGSVGSGTITSPNVYNTSVTGVTPGLHTYTWTISNGTCTSVDQVVMRVSRVVAKSAGNDQSVCGTTATMAAEAVTSGIGTWSQTSGPNTATFASTISNVSAVTGLVQGTYVFRWTVADGSCSSVYDEMTLLVNTAPTTPNAGTDQTLCNVTTATLAANTITNGNGTWSKVSGPTCTITTASNPSSTVTEMTPGTYVFRWTASNGSCAELTDEVTIVNNNPPTTAAAGSDIRICMYSPFNFAANTPSIGTGSWSQVSGSPVNFTNAASPTTTITGAIAGSYTFRWSISNGVCSASTDDVNLIVDASVTEPNAGPDQSITSATVTMAANEITTGAGLWTKVSGPIGAVITDDTLPTTSITNLLAGTYVFRWTATNGTCTSYDNVSIVVTDKQTYDIIATPTFTTCNLSWSKGSRTSRVVFLKEGTGTITSPVSNTTYTASTNWLDKGSQTGSSGYYCIYNGTGTSVQLTGLYPGRTYTVRAYEYNGSAGSESYLTNMTGTLNPITFVPWPTTTFFNAAGVTTEQDWNTSARWDHDTIPSLALHEAVLVYVDGNCVVNADHSCYNLTIKAAHDAISPKLTISAGSSLHVAGGPLGGQFKNLGTVNALLIKASAVQPNGTLTWKTGNPSGSVEMYSKASWDLTKPVNNKYKWQFMGIPVKSTSYTSTFSSCYLREWDETVVRYEDVWARKNDGTSLQKGSGSTLTNNKGYELVQQFPRTYTFKGVLQHDDFVQALPYTTGAYFVGQHIFGNPFTAAIDIRSIEFGPNTQSSVYQYNCGTYMDWIDNKGENVGIDGTELTPAQYAVATKQTAGVLGILRQVPSMQGFLVKSTNEAGGSITIPYPTVMKNSIHQRAKQDPDVAVVATRLDVKGTNFTDKMWIFVDPTCSAANDNGWDGIKIFGDPAVTQIYALEDDGGVYQICARNCIHETNIAFKPGNDTNFTLKFTHQNISSLYNKLYLIDIVANRVIDVTATASEYSFTATASDPVKRFKVVTSTGTTTDNDRTQVNNNIDVYTVNNKVIINNRNSEKANIALYDEIGRCLTNAIAESESSIELPVSLSKGVYLIHLNVFGNKLTKRIIVR